jgi:predicted adenine nucleotide alpha hydrolase (AANH) superfamily ATPase
LKPYICVIKGSALNIVLHICCGVCAAGAAQTLVNEGHAVRGFFYNPNIHPEEEYLRRMEAVRTVAQHLQFPIDVGPYTPDDWLGETAALKNEPEGGRRCEVCFKLRLKKTYQYMLDCNAEAFTTTLTISPRKSALIVNRIGREIDDKRFLVRDFKKKDGFLHATQLAKKWDLYRQYYCGCTYSMQKGETDG